MSVDRRCHAVCLLARLPLLSWIPRRWRPLASDCPAWRKENDKIRQRDEGDVRPGENEEI
jgi:hypothetical protein